jgi:hypothetical protein
LEHGAPFPVTVDFKTTNAPAAGNVIPASENVDYNAHHRHLNFNADGTQLIRVPILGDAASEGKKPFFWN